MTPIIECDSLQKSFHRTPVLMDVTANFEARRCHAIVGENGAGKSVLLKILTGLLRPDSGLIRRSGEIEERGRIRPGEIGAVVDRPAFLPFTTGYRNLSELARIRRVITDEDIRATCHEVGLDPDLEQHVRSYSLGMKQKLGLVQALMERPRLLVLDEPFNALDQKAVTRTHRILRDRRARGTTVIFTSHNAADVDELADQVWRLDSGRLSRER